MDSRSPANSPSPFRSCAQHMPGSPLFPTSRSIPGIGYPEPKRASWPTTSEEPPDIAIEIVSPQQSVNRLVRRCIRFNEDGVRIALLVDPRDESVMDFRSGALPRGLRGDDP